MSGRPPTLYERISVDPGCTIEELRAAYRAKARALHPDVSGVDDDGRSMASLNEAWKCLSDPKARLAYDLSLHREISKDRRPPQASSPSGAGDRPPATRQGPPTFSTPSPSRRPPWRQTAAGNDRKHAWIAATQSQIGHLASTAGRSATQTLLLSSPRATRTSYDALVQLIVADLCLDTEARVRSARAAGAAPLDLGVAATLVGIRTLADRIRRQSSLGVTTELIMTAELLDRMWDVLAHELPNTLEVALGANPNVARTLAL